VTPSRILIGASIFLVALSAVLSLLNVQKTRRLHAQVTQSEVARNRAEQLQIAQEKELKAQETLAAAANTKFGEIRTKAANTEGELTKAQKEKNDLQTKLRESELKIEQLLNRIEDIEGRPTANTNSSIAPIQFPLGDAKKQVDNADREKAPLPDKARTSQERSTRPETEKKKQLPVGGNPAIRGTVLAVNQVYNFVVLNLGGRQGVEPNTEMLVLRDGSFIGKIRVSSVEPATAIGDIISGSLARGVQVQPGDTVIYAGSN
jgi:hypothetical protein